MHLLKQYLFQITVLRKPAQNIGENNYELTVCNVLQPMVYKTFKILQ
jgi:hypothetical protein